MTSTHLARRGPTELLSCAKNAPRARQTCGLHSGVAERRSGTHTGNSPADNPRPNGLRGAPWAPPLTWDAFVFNSACRTTAALAEGSEPLIWALPTAARQRGPTALNRLRDLNPLHSSW